MSTIKSNNHQIGQSATATNNMTWYQPSTPDGTVRLGVGNAGATTTDLITASATALTLGKPLNLPTWTTGTRPASPTAGTYGYNTTYGSPEYYTGSAWVVMTLIPIMISVTGTIYVGVASNLTLSMSNNTDTVSINYTRSGVVLNTQTNITVTSGSATVAVPSAVYNAVSNGDVIAISVINADGTPSSNSVNTTVQGIPTGGTITTSGSNRIHTFTTSGTFTIPTGFSKTYSYLCVAGAGGGGGSSGDGVAGGGGAGAGGMLTGSSAWSAGSYTVTVGGGGGGGGQGSYGGQGNASSIAGITSTTGGGAGRDADDCNVGASNGGSGGGASGSAGCGAGSGTAGQGNDGGSKNDGNAGSFAGGGGGGKGAAGSGRTPGGGSASSISGASVTYAAGGYGQGTGNFINAGVAGGANTGNGGNGAYNGSNSGGSGGSGVVIISYTFP